MTHGASGVPEPAVIVAKYEALREVAGGAALAPEARNGLALFLRRGMWSWTCAVDAAREREVEPSRSSPSSSLPDERKVVVRLLAAMAMPS